MQNTEANWQKKLGWGKNRLADLYDKYIGFSGLDLSSIDMKDEDAIFNINDLVWGFLMKKEEEQIKQNLKTNIQESSK